MRQPVPANARTIAEAARILRDGGLVAMPTETVYGLAADATNPHAVAAIFAAKGRPLFNPLITHVPDLAAARELASFSPLALQLAGQFWPGPLTLVLDRKPASLVCDLACAGLATIALRVPAGLVALELLRATGRPLVAPSANPSGRPSPTLAAHVSADLGGHIAMVLDGGPCALGLESTVVRVDGDAITLLRPGALPVQALEAVAGPLLLAGAVDQAAPMSPGMTLRHYAPDAPVQLERLTAPPGAILLGFGPVDGIGPDGADPEWSLSVTGNDKEAATRLFALLRAADALQPDAIHVAPIPDAGLGLAINDRLRRAAGLI